MQAIILAGGKGTRLKPFTTNFPKPLVPIGEVPILEVVLRQLRFHGFRDVVLAVSHLSELIMAFCGDGKKFGLDIRYSKEDRELGTAGPLSLIDSLERDFLVMNGDILTTLDYRKLFEHHRAHGNDVTISVCDKRVDIDLGVIETQEDVFTNYIEKPSYSFTVSMGVYVFGAGVVPRIPRNERMDMPDLMLKLKKENRKIGCYRGEGFWLDIGRIQDYETALEIFSEKRKEFLPDG